MFGYVDGRVNYDSSLSIFLNATHSSSWAECSGRCLLSRRPLLKYCADFEKRLLSFSNGAKLLESSRSSLTASRSSFAGDEIDRYVNLN